LRRGISKAVLSPLLSIAQRKGKEAKRFVDDHVVDFLYENKISLNVVNSRSLEIILESIGHMVLDNGDHPTMMLGCLGLRGLSA
jgi:hypothetical protein